MEESRQISHAEEFQTNHVETLPSGGGAWLPTPCMWLLEWLLSKESSLITGKRSNPDGGGNWQPYLGQVTPVSVGSPADWMSRLGVMRSHGHFLSVLSVNEDPQSTCEGNKSRGIPPNSWLAFPQNRQSHQKQGRSEKLLTANRSSRKYTNYM